MTPAEGFACRYKHAHCTAGRHNSVYTHHATTVRCLHGMLLILTRLSRLY